MYTHIKTQSDVRCFLEINGLLLCGENEGYCDLIDIANLRNIHSCKLDKVSHIYQLEKIGYSEMAIAAYNGIFFASISIQKGQQAKVSLSEEVVLKGKFCNKVLHLKKKGILLVAVWDTPSIYVVSLETKE